MYYRRRKQQQVPRPLYFFFFSSRRRHTRCSRDWSSDVCSSDLPVDGHSSASIADAAFQMERYRGGCSEDVDRKSVVWGKSVDLGGRRIIKKKKGKDERVL